MKLRWQVLDLRLRDPFTIARESSVERRNVIVSLEHGGTTGLGEAAPSTYYRETAETVVESLARLAPLLEPLPPEAPEALEAMDYCLSGQGAARAAVDIALYDLSARAAGQPLLRYLDLPVGEPLETSFTIALDTQDGMVHKAECALQKYPTLKVKAGRRDDISAIRAIAELGPARLRVDANGGWSVEEAVEKMRLLEELEVEFVEQPIAAGNLAGLETLRERTSLPILLDEDAVSPADIPAIAPFAFGVNVKLMKCGGIRRALAAIRTAREHGLRIMLGCMIETAIGITAAANLASLADFADLDGNLLLEWDPYRGVEVVEGRLMLPEGHGLGVTPRAPQEPSARSEIVLKKEEPGENDVGRADQSSQA